MKDEQVKTSYNLETYSGEHMAEQALDFMHTILTNDPNARFMSAIQKDGRKSIVIEETNGNCADVRCNYSKQVAYIPDAKDIGVLRF